MTIPPNIAYADASFKSSGSTTARTHGARAADVINVKDYGAIGDDATDDTAAIQAAIDAAFGAAGSPHGYTNRALNKALYFPVGTYRITSSLIFTHVYGGRIYGDNIIIGVSGAGSSPTDPAIVVDGMVETFFENINLFSQSGSAANLDLDWNGTWADLPVAHTNGLRHNVFSHMSLGTADMGIRVANSGNDGAFNTFMNVLVQSTGSAGIELVGTDAIGNMSFGGGMSVGLGGGRTGYKMSGGNFSIISGMGNGASDISVSVDSPYPVTILGGRIETGGGAAINMTNGLVMAKGFNFQDGGTLVANIDGGKLILDGCFFGAGSTITGSSGTLYMRGCTTIAGIHSTYTGTVAQEI